MSPDNHKQSKAVRDLLKLEKSIDGLGTEFARFIRDADGDFRGFSIILSDRGGYLAIIKKFGDDGTPQVLFAGGESPIECIRAADIRISSGNWKEDTPQRVSTNKK